MDISETSDTFNTLEKSNTRFLDPIDFINKTYKTFSLLDLQDALIAFSKSKGETKAKIDKIIPKNFAKFINCKGLMGRIKQDYKDRYLLETNFDKEISLIVQKFESLVSKHNIQLEDSNVVDSSRSLIFPIKEVKEVLRSNMLNLDIFISTLKSQEEAMEKYGQRFKNELLKEIKRELKEFLDCLYDRIVIKRNGFEEICRLVEMYLYVLNFGEEENTDVQKSKLINTMLVKFKEDTLNNFKMNDEYHSYLFRSLIKMLEQADEAQGIEAIHHVFSCFKRIMISTDPKYSKIVMRRIEDFRKSFKGASYSVKEIKNESSYLRTEVFKHFAQSASIPESVEIFDSFIGILKESEIKKAQEILSQKTIKHLLSSELKKFEYLEKTEKVLKIVKRWLGHEESKTVKTLEKTLRERDNQELESISRDFSKLFNKQNDDVKILMEASKIISRGKSNAFRIFLECKDKISSRPVVLSFLHKFLKTNCPALSNFEKEMADKLKSQFDGLADALN
jgi:hypothetical protein